MPRTPACRNENHPLRIREACRGVPTEGALRPSCGWAGMRQYPNPPGTPALGAPCPSCGGICTPDDRPCPADHWTLRLVLRALERAAREVAPAVDGRWGGLSPAGLRLCERVRATAAAARWWKTPLYACATALVNANIRRGLAARTRSPTAHARHRQQTTKHLDEFWQRLRSVPLPKDYDARAAERALQAAEWQS